MLQTFTDPSFSFVGLGNQLPVPPPPPAPGLMGGTDFESVRGLIYEILSKPHGHSWSLQGFGMLRLYLGKGTNKNTRLHIWDSRYQVENVSLLHNHPWNFNSLVVSGEIRNTLYQDDDSPSHPGTRLYSLAKILCGPGGGVRSEATKKYLRIVSNATYTTGQRYAERAEIIHQSHPSSGAVTLVTRDVIGTGDHAIVAWPDGENWVSAEPRPATWGEIQVITSMALKNWTEYTAPPVYSSGWTGLNLEQPFGGSSRPN